MSCKAFFLAVIMAMGTLLGTACGSNQEENELPARPGENPPGYERPNDLEHSPMHPETAPDGGDPDSSFQPEGREQGQGMTF